MEQVLMIDDDVELCEMVAEYLALEEFAVTAVHDGPSGIEKAREGTYSLVLLDVMLPGLNGFEVLRRLRAGDAPQADVPVLMLTARGNAVDRIVGLEVGADDYLPKPFDERELVARMRAILRRARPASLENTLVGTENSAREMLQVGDVTVDVGARRARRDGEELMLTAVEFDTLVLLLRAAGNVVSREQITKEVLDRKLLAFDRSVDTHISRLRRKLGPHPNGAERLKTVRGIGYIYALAGDK
ncbi:MAG TPA: response regulator transcription factor [Abditibacteriaceae bacterium]|jgi:two-component system response regulator CpxR